MATTARVPPPPPFAGPKDVFLGVRISKPLSRALEAYAKANGLTASAAVVHLLGWALSESAPR